ncbi:MAG: prepilin-type N-terminal cleavage/methylation domain-containing protein [Phycisphaerae bacterium]|nr:prepilin-type N-terminal cleavage/methylation domain-containing protein [Phycisphaerae bacterium]NIU09276.1 prepilin-type N-terminal cleavage/methylation domain-containing protein [Phycisphaerae bacterium]NIU56948.1 prepilin-type N-terminal cleavage/methylation domain-containing protein [Phycisphaerae bacterium]NIW93394.1 prepilin-type N-terminal cleavage/methylation domain-containing protein [Phycisphaerae bacterium]NIW98972.1 prepilin-type N-terminal cleavage/methylation domain-containing 
MSGTKNKDGGFTIAEVIVALVVLGMVVSGLALSLQTFAKLNRCQWMKQRCIAAAQAQLDSIAVTGEAIRDEDFRRLWPNLSVSIEESAGAGQWEGMKLVQVTANGRTFGKEVKVQLCRYFLDEREQ